MRPADESNALIWDALQFARNTQIAIADADLNAFMADGPTTWATERQVSLLGEALRKLREVDPTLAAQIPDLHRIVGMRNVLVHGYVTVDHEIVWIAVTTLVPKLVTHLESLLP